MTTRSLDLVGFSEKLLKVYQVGDPDLVMTFLEKHKGVMLFHQLIAKCAVDASTDPRQMKFDFHASPSL